MNLVKCENSHFYDEERYPSCPHCAAPALRDESLTVPAMRTPQSDAVTVAHDEQSNVAPPTPVASSPVTEALVQNTSSLQQAVQAASVSTVNAQQESNEKTVGFFSSTIGLEPVVGWLVCTVGEHFGEDFKLKSGRNFIGRSLGMDVAVVKDGTVSRERHAIVVYEPRGNIFIVQPGDSKELCYVNDDVVLSAKELKAHDKLTVGKTELMFIPCCTAAFNWDMVKPEDKPATV